MLRYRRSYPYHKLAAADAHSAIDDTVAPAAPASAGTDPDASSDTSEPTEASPSPETLSPSPTDAANDNEPVVELHATGME